MASRPDEPLVELPQHHQIQMPHAPDAENIAAIEAAKEGLRLSRSINQTARELGIRVVYHLNVHPQALRRVW
jgi:hypothetical protein